MRMVRTWFGKTDSDDFAEAGSFDINVEDFWLPDLYEVRSGRGIVG